MVSRRPGIDIHFCGDHTGLEVSLFVAAGSCGTIAGLLLGARLAGLGCRIVGVQIVEEDVANRRKIARLVNGAARYLRRRDPSIPRITIGAEEVELLDGYLGGGYAHPTADALDAVRLVARAEGLPLVTTYTGKAMAALLGHAAHHPGSRLLFLDTFTESTTLDEGEYHSLPERFWPAFDPAHRVGCWCLRAWRAPGFLPESLGGVDPRAAAIR